MAQRLLASTARVEAFTAAVQHAPPAAGNCSRRAAGAARARHLLRALEPLRHAGHATEGLPQVLACGDAAVDAARRPAAALHADGREPSCCSSTRKAEPAALKDRCCHRTAKLSKGRCVDGNARVRLPRLDLQRRRPRRAHPAVRGRPPDPGRLLHAGLPLRGEATATPGSRSRSPSRRSPRCPSSTTRPSAPSSSSTRPGPPARCARWRTASTTATSASCTRRPSAWRRSPSRASYQLVERDGGFYAETVIDAVNPPAYHAVSGTTEPITQRHMRNAYYLPFSRRLDIEYPSGIRHIIINCFTPIDDGHIQLAQWLFRNDTRGRLPGADADRLRPRDHARGQGHPRVHRPRCAWSIPAGVASSTRWSPTSPAC
jgi:hypothetical protein